MALLQISNSDPVLFLQAGNRRSHTKGTCDWWRLRSFINSGLHSALESASPKALLKSSFAKWNRGRSLGWAAFHLMRASG